MAEKWFRQADLQKTSNCFNPHHTGEWLKRIVYDTVLTTYTVSFNPHHTGEWLKSTSGHRKPDLPKAEFQSSSYWRMAEKMERRTTRRMRGNPFQSSSYWRMAEKGCQSR